MMGSNTTHANHFANFEIRQERIFHNTALEACSVEIQNFKHFIYCLVQMIILKGFATSRARVIGLDQLHFTAVTSAMWNAQYD